MWIIYGDVYRKTIYDESTAIGAMFMYCDDTFVLYCLIMLVYLNTNGENYKDIYIYRFYLRHEKNVFITFDFKNEATLQGWE